MCKEELNMSENIATRVAYGKALAEIGRASCRERV